MISSFTDEQYVTSTHYSVYLLRVCGFKLLGGFEEGWGNFVGLVVGDGVVGGGGDDDVVGEVDVEEAGGFVEFFGVFDVAKCWFN